MASRGTPKGRVHLERVTPHGELDDSQGMCVPPIAGVGLHTFRNKGHLLLRHYEVVVVWPCPRTLPPPALAVACGAVGGEPHPRNAHDFNTLHRAVPECPRWGPGTPPMPLRLGDNARPMPGGLMEGRGHPLGLRP